MNLISIGFQNTGKVLEGLHKVFFSEKGFFSQ